MLVYLDNNATTRPDPRVVDAMTPYLTEFYGNPSSVHRFGQRARVAIDEARQRLAAALGCGDSEILLTGGGTEAINTAVRGLAASRRTADAARRRIVTSTVEHSATRELCQHLVHEGLIVDEVPVDSLGRLDLDRWRAAVASPHTALATLMWANNETGVTFPVRDAVEACRAARVPVHVDATQAVGKIPVNLREVGVDAASFASHKFHGPKGVGGLYVRRGIRLPPLLIGGPQERGRRGGTEHVPGIVGMGLAAELAVAAIATEMPRVSAMRDRLEQFILASIPQTSVNGATESRLPNTTNISFAALEAEAILLLLSEQEICASAGAACSSGSLEPSHVLRAMAIPERVAHGAVRFSLSRFTTDSEVDRALSVLPGVIDRLRAVLPV